METVSKNLLPSWVFFFPSSTHWRRLLSRGRVHTPCALPHDPPMVRHTGSEGVNNVETRVMFNIDRLSGLEQTFTTLSVCFQVVKEAEQMTKNKTLISHMRFFQQELVNYLRCELKFDSVNLKWEDLKLEKHYQYWINHSKKMLKVGAPVFWHFLAWQEIFFKLESST